MRPPTPSSPPSSPRSAPPAATDGELYLERLPGRLRYLRHGLMLVPVALVCWIWFGFTGAVPGLIWWWHRRPRRRKLAAWQVDLTRAHQARLGPWRTCIAFRGLPALEIFNDEISGRDLARLRRTLKVQLAAGRSTSRRSEKPGNRIVSSERDRVSG